jgi:hypothetical protein
MFNARNFRDFLAVLISGLALFFLAPIYMTIQSDNGVKGFDLLVFSQVASVYFILYAVLFSVIVVIGRSLKYNSFITVSATFILVWVVVSTLLFPLSGNSGMVSPQAVPLDIINLILISVVAIILTLLVATKLVWLPYIFSAVIALGVTWQVSGFISERLSNNRAQNNEAKQGFSELSADKNIIVLSFDGIPSNVVEDIFKNNASLKAGFKDFVFFHNAFSAAPATTASVTSELFGNRSYRKSGSDGERLNLDSERSLLPLNQLKNAYAYGYGAYASHQEDSTKVISTGVYSNYLFVYDKFKDSFYRLGLTVTRSIGSLGYRALINSKVWDYLQNTALYIYYTPTELDAVIENYSNADWKLGFVPQVYDFYGLVDSLKVSANVTHPEPYLRMMHFAHTHFPVDFDENCDIRGTDKEWVETNQNYQGLYNQGICELNQFVHFLNKLKQLGIYDNSLIVLKSDHGEPATYYDNEPHSLKINGNPLWGVNRYMPLLMVKGFNVSGESVRYNDLLVGLPDLANTVCRASGLENCEYFEGVDLNSPTQEGINSYPYIFIDVVKDETSSFTFETHKTVKFDRRAKGTILELFRNSKEIVLD